jgi:hypothetical protein
VRNSVTKRNVVTAFLLIQGLLSIRHLTLVRKHMKIKNVAWHLVFQVFLVLREFILRRNILNVRSVGKPLVWTQTLLNISDFILVKSPMNVRNVGRPIVVKQTLLDIREFILVKNLTNVRSVGKHLPVAHT